MITNTDLQAITLSPTKKDFYQIWNELLDTAKKLSDRWDPTATNESDPGIVLLKVLTAVADKVNYNIDKNILEAFMPSAAQYESMRKLCDMMGYNIKYYQSATTKVLLTYVGDRTKFQNSLQIPFGMSITDTDGQVNYVVYKSTTLAKSADNLPISTELDCIEGQLIYCNSDNDNIITLSQIDDKNRYYLPEVQIAENGIFVYNYTINSAELGEEWTKVDNLNTQELGTRRYKFGYDSRTERPYIQFPNDIANLIGDGLSIICIRTSGINGNVKAKQLNTFTIPEDWENFEQSDFTISNNNAAVNGANIETIAQAYDGFKKTVGTFDTLVTCRDYMNKIYQLTVSDTDTTPLVSNVIVSDIRDDINRSVTICSFDNFGISYIQKSLKDGDNDKISHFDLVLYPFTTVYGFNTKEEYDNSFKYSGANIIPIKNQIEEYKTISHNITKPNDKEIACIKNYLKLNAIISTTYKVDAYEEQLIIANIKEAIYKNFNMRKLDFGEEIPFDTILEVIENADTRIKNVALDEPILYTKYVTVGGDEYDQASDISYYNKLARRNILAGKVPLFNYNTDFGPSFDEAQAISAGDIVYNNVTKLEPKCEIKTSNIAENDYYTLKENEYIKFRAPNLKTIVTYPAYVNYFIKLNDKTKPIPANADYELKSDEYLLLNYTTTDSETGEKILKNKPYGAGTIIRPNFDLIDSETKHDSNNVKYNKNGGFDFSGHQGISQPAGMYTLGINEQIEIRDFVTVELTDSIQYLYLLASKSIKEDDSYVLQDNEYLFYTDINKQEFAYYGSGTKITNNSGIEIKAENITADANTIYNILENGINAINFKLYNLSTTNNIVLQEYQYITLTAGDIIYGGVKGIKDGEKVESLIDLDNNWLSCTFAEYKFANSDAKQKLSDISIGDCSWEVRSGLLLNTGPNKTQILNYTAINEQGTDVVIAEDSITVTYYDSQQSTTIAGLSNIELGVKLTIDVSTGLDEILLPNVKLKVFKHAAWGLHKNNAYTPITLNNLNDNWTTVALKNIADTDSSMKFNFTIPNDSFSLWAIYLDTAAKVTLAAYKADDNPPAKNLSIYNKVRDNSYADFIWWGDKDPGVLRQGLNIVYISPDVSYITITNTSKTQTGNLIFAMPDNVYNTVTTGGNKTFGINLALIDYKATGNENPAEKLLKDIKTDDPDYDFYYNCIIDQSNAIDINTLLLNTDDPETLGTPEIWYDKNNINNKFVISEIDSNYLDKGIRIARSSKLY